MDETNGCYCNGVNNVPVFILIPRSFSIQNSGNKMVSQEKSFEHLLQHFSSNIRGKTRPAVSEKYMTIGSHARRGSHGISTTQVPKKVERDYNTVVKLARRSEHIAKPFLPHGVYNLMKQTKELCGWSGMRKVQDGKFLDDETTLWPSAAITYDYASAAHNDQDFYFSLINVTTSEGLDNSKYWLNQPIAQYFIFPQIGIAVALRPGDNLIFNPLYYHCASTKEVMHYKNKVYLSSCYIKTAIVGKNDNRIPIANDPIEKYKLCN